MKRRRRHSKHNEKKELDGLVYRKWDGFHRSGMNRNLNYIPVTYSVGQWTDAGHKDL